MKRRNGLAWFGIIILFAVLACSQAGEIVSPEEATARAVEAFTPTPARLEQGNTAFNIGDEVVLISDGPVVPMKETVAAPNAIYFAPTGQTGSIIESQNDDDGLSWYRVESTSGTGWVNESQIESPETIEEVDADDGQSEGEGEGVVAQYAIGDELYIIGQGFMINVLEAPGAVNMVSQETRGTVVTVTDVTELDGAAWYLIDGVGLPGWVVEENLTSEAP